MRVAVEHLSFTSVADVAAVQIESSELRSLSGGSFSSSPSFSNGCTFCSARLDECGNSFIGVSCCLAFEISSECMLAVAAEALRLPFVTENENTY
jgi:hypothetical protein